VHREGSTHVGRFRSGTTNGTHELCSRWCSLCVCAMSAAIQFCQ
jgi:hypothetical protein